MKGTLTQRLTLYVLLATGSILFVSFLAYYHEARRLMVAQVEKHVQTESEQVAEQLEAALRDAQDMADECVLPLAKLQRTDTAAILGTLRRMVANHEMVSGVTVAYAALPGRPMMGIQVFQYKPGGDELGHEIDHYDYSQRPWYATPFKTRKPFWTDLYAGRHSGKPKVTYAVPILSPSGKPFAVMAIGITMNWLFEYADYALVHSSALCVITDSTGRVLAGDSELGMHSGDKLRRAFGADTLVCSNKLGQKGWVMHTLIPHSEIYGALPRLLWSMVAVCLLSLVVLALLSSHIIHRISAPFIAREAALSAQNARIENEMSVARRIQQSMLPASLPQRPECCVWARQKPAREVGGDMFDCFVNDGVMFFAIGDVSGKGMPAALLMTVVSKTLRLCAARTGAPEMVCEMLNSSLCDNNRERLFCTFFLGALNLASGKLRYCSAGHNPPVLIPKGGDEASFIKVQPRLPLGIKAGVRYVVQEMQLQPGDKVFVYTDGVNEAENAATEQFGDSRMLQALQDTATATPEEMGSELLRRVGEFAAGAEQNDDITAMIVQYNGPQAALHLPVSRAAVDQIGPFVDAMNLDAELASKVNLALEEVVVNVVDYAHATEEIQVTMQRNGETIDICVRDNGQPFDMTQAQTEPAKPQDGHRPIGGLGIFLVKRMTTALTYRREDGHNLLQMSFAPTPPPKK